MDEIGAHKGSPPPKFGYGKNFLGLLHAAGRGRQVLWSLGDQIVVSGGNFITSVLVARSLGVTEFGVFALAWMAVLFAQSIQLAAISQPLMSIGPKLPASEKANYYTVMLLEQLAFGAVAGLVVCGIAVATAVNAGQEQPFRIAISLLVVVFFSQLQDFFRRHSFSRSRADLALRSDAARFAVQLGLLGFFYRGTTPLEIDQILYIIALSSLVAILSIAPSISVPTLPIAGASQILARQARSAQWLVGSALMQWTTGNFFILVAGAMLGPVAVGALRACQNLIGATHIFFQAADNFVPPRASAALHSGGVTALKAMLRPVLATGLVVTLIICAILCYDPEMWLGLVYGAEFEHYGYVLYWLSAVYIFAVLASPARYALSAMELTFPLFKGYGVATVFSLFSAHILIYFLGIHGALVGLVTCDAILLYVFTASWFRHEYNHPE